MEPRAFFGQNTVIAKDQPQYKPLPAMIENGRVLTCWQPNEKDKQAIAEGKPIWLWILTHNQPLQPLSMTTENPFVNEEMADEPPQTR